MIMKVCRECMGSGAIGIGVPFEMEACSKHRQASVPAQTQPITYSMTSSADPELLKVLLRIADALEIDNYHKYDKELG